MCPVIAKVIATFSMVFQNEANLNLSFRKNIFFSIGGGEWEGGESDRMATQAFTEEEEFKSSQGGLSGGGGWGSGLSLERDFSSAGTDTCPLALLLN